MIGEKQKRNVILLLLQAIILVVITYCSLMPAKEIELPTSDKTGHFLAYFSLAVSMGISRSRRTKPFLVLLFCLFYGILMEGIQHFVPGRSVSFYDILANTSGALTGMIFLYFEAKWSLREYLFQKKLRNK